MNATTHTAFALTAHRAATLDRENEMIRRQAERPTHTGRPSGVAVVTDFFTTLVRRPVPRIAAVW